MPRQPTATESLQKMLIDGGFLEECEETRKGEWGPSTRAAYVDAIWKVAHPSGIWTYDSCRIAEHEQPVQVPMDLKREIEKRTAAADLDNT